MAHMFPEKTKPHGMDTRHEEKYTVKFANEDSAVIYMQKLINQNDQNQD